MKKTKMFFTQNEWRLLVTSLNALRNRLLGEGRYTDTVNDTMLAVMNAKTKRIRVAG
ncbi:MAG: hypothetical protein LBS74_08900 [Oscillospiraceae bacterium]|jgi:hypothetical protein|nr:hypothetical protein [Oscillospiraceae bacterium]